MLVELRILIDSIVFFSSPEIERQTPQYYPQRLHFQKIGYRRYKYLVLGHEETYFVKEHSDSKNKYSEDDIMKILAFLFDYIFVVFAGKSLQADSRHSNG